MSAELHTQVCILGQASGIPPDIIASGGTCKEVSLEGECLVTADAETVFEVCPLRAYTGSNAKAKPRRLWPPGADPPEIVLPADAAVCLLLCGGLP